MNQPTGGYEGESVLANQSTGAGFVLKQTGIWNIHFVSVHEENVY